MYNKIRGAISTISIYIVLVDMIRGKICYVYMGVIVLSCIYRSSITRTSSWVKIERSSAAAERVSCITIFDKCVSLEVLITWASGAG